MRRLLVAGLLLSLLGSTPNRTSAQTTAASASQKADSNPTWLLVASLLYTHQVSGDKIVRKQVEATLGKMGPAAAQPLMRAVDTEFKAYKEAATSSNPSAKDQAKKHLDTVKTAIKVLGKLGSALVRDDEVVETLLTFTYDQAKMDDNLHLLKTDLEGIRLEAMEALGRIFSQKAVFLVLQSPTKLTEENNKEAQTAVAALRDEAQDLKRHISTTIEHLNPQKMADNVENARLLTFDARLLIRRFKSQYKLILIMSELEPPTGKDIDLATRINQALSEIESNLRAAWAPPPQSKESNAENYERRARNEALTKADQKANELCDEMDDLVRRVDGWLSLNNRTRKVIMTLGAVFLEPQTLARPDGNTPAVIITVTEALGRIYGNRD
jgi:hypothetical protein